MTTPTENIPKVIQQNDPLLREHPHLDFQFLRQEGLKHIGALSGKIWTDHNAHDPGITILEVLCYALLDLGYRTTLPIEDLLARKIGIEPDAIWQEDDNFYTPLQILTCNPTTITDYRKLLLEIKEVRNAWLEVATEQEVPLYINHIVDAASAPGIQALDCKPANKDCQPQNRNRSQALKLNGLYNIFIEKQPDASEDAIFTQVQDLLSRYRNLCEDFCTMTILCPEPIGICADVEMTGEVPAETVYENILRRLQQFIAPEITYYTLQEMLSKGKTIEEIYAGRPFLAKSVGFVDTEELENLTLRTEIFMSDIYAILLNVPGVKAIRKLEAVLEGVHNSNPTYWTKSFKIKNGYIPSFSLEKTCIQLRNSSNTTPPLNKARIHRLLATSHKVDLVRRFLDEPVPIGRYYPNLSEYNSIQNDFPVVYGIGEEGLPENATLLRKAQALQLQGYLLFYDQLLADYLVQLTRLRDVFSLQQESKRTAASRHTYFAQNLKEVPVPAIDKLIRFFNNESTPTTIATVVANDQTLQRALKKLQASPRKVLQIGVVCTDDSNAADLYRYNFPTIARRAIFVQQALRDFDQRDFVVQIQKDKEGYFFLLCFTEDSSFIFLGFQRFKTAAEAQNAAEQAAFLATIQSSYQFVNRLEGADHAAFMLDLVYNPVNYLDALQRLSEDTASYHQRREAILNHLLARFAEQFTDYILFNYDVNHSETTRSIAAVEAKSHFLSQYDELSRDRGRAFNYLEPVWNTANVSGLERRVSLLAGLSNWNRRSLCNFEVVKSARIELRDPDGNVLFSSGASYETQDAMQAEATTLLEQLREEENYPPLTTQLVQFEAIPIRRIFSNQPTAENIQASKYTYRLELKNANGQTVRTSVKTDYTSAEAAQKDQFDFVQEINNEKSEKGQHSFQLLQTDAQHYINSQALHKTIPTIITYKWHLYDFAGKLERSSEPVFDNYTAALDHFIHHAPYERFITTYTNAWYWEIALGNTRLRSVQLFADKTRATAAWRQAKVLGQKQAHYIVNTDNQLELRNENGALIALSPELPNDKEYLEALMDAGRLLFTQRRSTPHYLNVKIAYGFELKRETGESLLTSYYLYEDIFTSIKAMQTAFALGSKAKNYYKTGDEASAEYQFLLRDDQQLFIATASQAFETDKERNKALADAVRYFKGYPIPLMIQEEPRRYYWELYEDAGKKVALTSTVEFSALETAQEALHHSIIELAKAESFDFIKQQIHQIQVARTPVKFRFIFCCNTPSGLGEPFLKSQAEFDTEAETRQAYINFMQQLPTAQIKQPRKKPLQVVHGKEVLASLEAENSDSAAKARLERLLRYYRLSFGETPDDRRAFMRAYMTERQEGDYLYRLLKKDQPLATAHEWKNVGTAAAPKLEEVSYDTKAAAEAVKKTFCKATPPQLEINLKNYIICPSGDPLRYHYIIKIKIGEREYPLFISYKGYERLEDAEKAFRENWVKIVELASDERNYGVDRPVRLEEKYKEQVDPDCSTTLTVPYLVVIPKALGAIPRPKDEDRNLTVAGWISKYMQQFPIKIHTEDIAGQKIFKGYRFEFTNTTDNITFKWQSAVTYSSPETALEAYRLFQILLPNAAACRVLCKNGYYIGLLEILLESKLKYQTEDLAWDENVQPSSDPCDKQICDYQGVRALIEFGDWEGAFLPYQTKTEDGTELHGFNVIRPEYYIARHTCTYRTEKDRDDAMAFYQAQGRNCEGYNFQFDTGYNEETNKLIIHLGNGNILLPQEDYKPGTPWENIQESFLNWLPYLISKNNYKIKREGEKIVEVLITDEYGSQIAELRNGEQGKEPNMEDTLRIMRNYPIYKNREGKYCFRLFTEENSKPLDAALLLCGCEEPATDNSDEPKPPCSQPYIWESHHCYSCFKAAERAFNEFCLLLNTKENYYPTAESEIGSFSFEIINPAHFLARHPYQYRRKTDLLNAIERTKICLENDGMHLLEHILMRPQKGKEDIEDCACFLPDCMDFDCGLMWEELDEDDPCAGQPTEQPCIPGYIPGSDPYSFWATVVLPGWTKRFRHLGNRAILRDLLYKEAPAQVALNIVWLSPPAMCKFENSYQKWLSWMLDRSNYCRSEEEGKSELSPLCELIDCIKMLRNDTPCVIQKEETGDCDCLTPSSEIPSTDPCQPVTVDSLFWSDCPPDLKRTLT